MSAQHQFNPAPEYSNEVIDRLAIAIAARIPSAMDLLSKEEAAEYLKITYKTFERRLAKGHYPEKIKHWDGGTLLFIKLEIYKFVETQ